ncbi:hypothetical protein RJG79_05570 [Mycoplasmatota bacterium WC44]
MSKISNKSGNVLVNSLMSLLLSGIILTSISTTTISSYIIHDEMFDWSTQVKEARLDTQLVIIDAEQHLESSGYSWSRFRNFLRDNSGPDCGLLGTRTSYKNGIYPIYCTVSEVTINTEITVHSDPPSLYDYVIGTDGDLYLNGTSFIDGNMFADNIKITNHTLNDASAYSLDWPISIKPLLDEAIRTQSNYPYFNLGNTIGTNIYTNFIYGCYANQSTPCFSTDWNYNVIFPIDQNVSNQVELYTHEENNGSYVPTTNYTYNINVPTIDLGKKVDTIISNINEKLSQPKFEETVDPYSGASYHISNDIICYTNLNNSKGLGYNCRNKNVLNGSTSSTITNYSQISNTVYSNYLGYVTIDPYVTSINPGNNNILFINGDLYINDMNSSLELGGTIIVKGDVIIKGSIDKLSLTGSLYSFGTIDINLTSSVNGLTNGENEFGYLFAREHIIIKSNRDYHGVDTDAIKDWNMNGYLYADGSILIETDTYSSFNLNGGLYAKGNTDSRYPTIKLEWKENESYWYDVDYHGIMINSYSGEIVNSEYKSSNDPYSSRFVVTPHKASSSDFDSAINRYNVPTEFKDPIGEPNIYLTYKEVD